MAFVAATLPVIESLCGFFSVRCELSAEPLLAQAYSERRTLEVRIPGANYAPLRVERGTGGSNLDKPESLLKAEALIGENLQKNSADPTWLQFKARADLLDGNYDFSHQKQHSRHFKCVQIVRLSSVTNWLALMYREQSLTIGRSTSGTQSTH